MKSALIILVVLVSQGAWAQAEFVNPEALDFDSNDAVIEEAFFMDVPMEEPVFSSRKYEREIAALVEMDDQRPLENMGHLVVVKEIPYSYPWTSHSRIQAETLAEFEAELAKNQ